MAIILNNNILQSSTYGNKPYDTLLYGSYVLQDYSVVINAHYKLLRRFTKVVHAKYRIKSRYTRTEDTIEDIYVSATSRFMKLGCLDGPLLPYFSKAYDAEGDVDE